MPRINARGEVLLDALDGRRRRGLQEPGFELLTVGAVVDPVAGSRDPLPGRDHGGMAPTKLTSSRWPRAFTRRTQKPFSALW